MESAGQCRGHKLFLLLLLLFNAAPSHGHAANASGEARGSDPAPGWPAQTFFSRTVYSFEVREDAAPGTVVGKVAAASGGLTPPPTYLVEEDDGENLFLLGSLSGEFLLSRGLDFEEQSLYVVMVAAQQDGVRVSGVRAYFSVLNVNDNPPLFSRDGFSAALPEDTRAGVCFLSLNVSDKDGDSAEVKVVDGDEETIFFIDSAGTLCLNKELDRERRASYNLTVTATDHVRPESQRLSGTAHVVVVVEDVNDNAPVFVSASSVAVPEDAGPRSLVTTVHAQDEDAGSNGDVFYYLNSADGFSIDGRSGRLYLEQALDREQVDTLTVTVTAADRGSPAMAATMNLTVHVEDVNDHDPEFSQSSYSLTVREDVPKGTSLFQVQAHDRDIGPNGRVRYTLTQESPFVLDAVRGVITVMDGLDREVDSNYTLVILAADQGSRPRSSSVAVSITVLDVNDVVPWFSPPTLIIRVLENEEDPSQVTHQLSAVDEDVGVNGQLTYFMQNGGSDGLFSVTPNGTFQILHSLDREKAPLHVVSIVAVDSGSPLLTGTLTVSIVVDDVNDHRPQFTEEVYNTIVSEDSSAGTVFAMVTASDLDEGVSGEIRYFMENPDVPFAVEENSGELFTTDVLDREAAAVYRLTVIGSDGHPTRPLSSSVLVTVLIADVNDHWPRFTDSPYVAHVPTELAPGSVVCSVRATDEDVEMNAELRYSMYGQGSALFSIDPYSGTVFASTALRRTEGVIADLRVEDAGENPKFDVTTLSVRFENASDFPQTRVDVLRDSLSEDEPVGTLVAVVSAVSARAEPVSFYLASGNFEGTFHVEQFRGALTVENPLDYESKKEFTLLVEARDGGLPPFSSFAEIHVNIGDVNDNFPQFTQAEYRCEVFENDPPSWVCDVLAIDADSDGYGAVHYDITGGNDDRFFSIDPESGLLSTTVSLDREKIPEFSLTVEAAEPDRPLRKDRATIVVAVLDRNDNAPRFSQIFVAEVPEDAPPGHTVTRVTSVDDDAGPNAVVRYTITHRSDEEPFHIDVTTGCITVDGPLDRELRDRYVLRVNASDSAWSVGTDVTVVVTDANDNVPVFSDLSYVAVLPETEQTEVFVLQVLATDADVGQNGEILYVIEPLIEEFWVNASSGEIYTTQPLTLHHSAFEIYQFTVVAFDCGSVRLHSDATVTIRLEPHNRFPPRFLPSRPMVAVPYHTAVGTEVVQVLAVDPDVSNSSANIEYVSRGGNASDFFWIQADSGKVKLKQSLTESENLSLALIVVARDLGTPPLSSQTQISFEITGRNRFTPSFGEPSVTFSVPEDLPVGSVIGRIRAEDEDYGPNGAVVYRVAPENPFSPFSVGETSGLLTLITELDFEDRVFHHVRVEASDGGWVSKTGVLDVTLLVVDVNDNPPIFVSSEFVASVPENSETGTKVIDVKATDADSGANAQITYSLVAGHVEKFAVDSRNGTVMTLDVFDYEREQVFDVTVKASNIGGGSFSLARVVIQISDVNEFTPTFRKTEFNFSVFKNVPVGTRIGEVTAADGDRGSEGQVFYLMFGQNKYVGFDIDKLSGEIYTTRSLRKHGNTHIVLKVLAKNSGVINGTDVDEASVHVSVIDTNDAPAFTSALFVANVSEDSPVGTSVVTVSAADQDSALDWTRFFFSIESGNTNSSFAVDPLGGVVSVSSPLDRELWSVYNLTVTATDDGSPPATGTANVIVTVVDVNDNAPRLAFTEAQVKENQPPGTVVARLTASDSDSPPNQGPFTYWLVNPSDDAFSLTPDGVLFTMRPADREQTPTYRVLLAVRDAGIPALSSTTAFHITVVDENDNPPLPRNVVIEVKYFGSSFEGGAIGDVRPEDRDESDTFTCGIKSGPPNMFGLPNGTCELWSSPFQGEATFNITIEATDQLHFPVNNSIYVNYKGFTRAAVDSCILFYVASSSMEEFLSQKYLRFVKALDSLFNLQASKTHVFGIKRVGGEILLLAAVKNYNGEYLSREVASGVSAVHKKLLESQSNVTISHITSDPCLAGPCRNGATCDKNILIGRDFAVLESPVVIFVSPQKEVFNCTCPPGFTGTLCEGDVDECEGNPCENEGTCVNSEGSFSCRCPSGFSGSTCSTDADECLNVECQHGGTCVPQRDGYYCHCEPGFEGEMCERFIDHCGSSPCVQGSCTSSHAGFSCLCPFGVSGVHCEEHSYGFEELSFMEFPPLDRRTNLISLEFATVQTTSMLLFNAAGPSSGEFLALEILDGTVRLSYDLGSGPVRLPTRKQVADGRFHSVTARRIGNMGSLHVDNCTDVEDGGFCFSQSDGSSSDRTLDVGSSNMTIGGLRTMEFILLRPAQIRSHDFVGCIRNININGVPLRPSVALATYNVVDRCPRAAAPCHSDVCKNDGVCRDLWSDYLCECKSPFTGSNCATETSEEVALRFHGNDFVEYVIRERFRRDHVLKELLGDETPENNRDPTVMSVKFKTRDDGALVFVSGQAGYVLLKIEDRNPVFVSKDTVSGRLSEFTVDSAVTDGAWHVLSLSSDGLITILVLDGKPVLNVSDSGVDLTPVSVEKIVVGAALTDDSQLQQPGFSGCVQYFNVSGSTLPVSGHSAAVDVWPSSPPPCSEADAAGTGCLSGQCQSRWRCGPAEQNRSCICLRNVSDHICDVCTSASGGSGRCSEAPLWLTAVILPLISVLVVTGMFAALYRARRHKVRSQSESLVLKAEQATDNVAFCPDGAAPAENPMSADRQRSSVEFYRAAGRSHGRSEPTGQLEYYEVDSISSAFHSELSWHKHLYSTKCVKADLKMLLGGFKRERSGDDGTQSPRKPQRAASMTRQLLGRTDAERLVMKNQQPDLLEPVQCLTFEEISKLNAPLDQTASHGASPRSGPAESRAAPDDSSDTDGTFTCSESECGHVSDISNRKCGFDPSILSARNFTQQDEQCCHSEPGPRCDIQSDVEEII